MSIEFEKDETGQCNFFSIVVDGGKFVPWYGLPETEQQKIRRFISSKPERLTLEDFMTRYQIPIESFDSGNCFLTLGSPKIYPAGEDIQFVDKNTGFIRIELFFEEIDPDAALKEVIEYKDKKDRAYKPSYLTHYLYEPMTLDHPILGEQVDGVLITMKTWSIDKKYRRRDREELHSIFVTFDEEWDPDSGAARRWNTLLVESAFKETEGEEKFSVNKPAEFIEQYRTFLFPGVMFMYVTTGDPPRLVFSPMRRIDLKTLGLPKENSHKPDIYEKDFYQIGGRIITKENIPVDLGKPRRIIF